MYTTLAVAHLAFLSAKEWQSLFGIKQDIPERYGSQRNPGGEWNESLAYGPSRGGGTGQKIVWPEC
jgi:hypothetical protein